MRKLFILLFILFLYSYSYAFNPMVVCSGVPVASGGAACSGNYGNTSETETGNKLLGGGGILIQRIDLSSCTGGNPSSVNAYVKRWHNTDNELIIVVYSDNAGEPNSLLYQSSNLSQAGTDAAYARASTDPDITISDSYVWVGVQNEALSRVNYTASTGGTARYLTGESFGSPPATWNTAGDSAETNNYSIYIGF